MPTYDYLCNNCSNEFAVIKSISMIDTEETCPSCDKINNQRLITCQGGFFGEKDWDNVTYNPGLGMVTKSRKHAARVAKERGLIEIGNEKPDTIMAANAEKREREIDANFEESFAATKHHLMNSSKEG